MGQSCGAIIMHNNMCVVRGNTNNSQYNKGCILDLFGTMMVIRESNARDRASRTE